MLSFARRRVSALFEGLLASIVIATLAALLGIAAFTLAVQGHRPVRKPARASSAFATAMTSPAVAYPALSIS